ncbi:hypothetical protein [Cellulomonas cellasea]|uniref:Uncharacterized protein n=2 Tax=Cellulomonas cellasea TaxID=43670 RepID=A0A0A0BC70_9CELL|nr:hypothetical protein Q760_11870 [Cellulomonas cellasea DSM 20118]GEA88588.1 hypothetical protein CCE01nite_25370 [Cellulomonas cellasea]
MLDRTTTRPGATRAEGRATPTGRAAAQRGTGVLRRLRSRFVTGGHERGDVPGWVLVTLMTAGLVVTLWAVAGPRLAEVFEDSLSSVQGPGN